jgi:solute carrier family 66, member 2
VPFKAIVLQRLYYGNAAPATSLEEDDDIEQEALALSEE